MLVSPGNPMKATPAQEAVAEAIAMLQADIVDLRRRIDRLEVIVLEQDAEATIGREVILDAIALTKASADSLTAAADTIAKEAAR